MRKEFEHLPEQVSKAGDKEPDASWGGSQEEGEGLSADLIFSTGLAVGGSKVGQQRAVPPAEEGRPHPISRPVAGEPERQVN